MIRSFTRNATYTLYRTTATLAMITMLLSASFPRTGAAQAGNSNKALKLFGQFAMHVAEALTAAAILEQVKPTPHAEATTTSRPQAAGYSFNLKWNGHDGTYSGALRMRGAFGTFRVATPGAGVVVQDMRVERDSTSNDLLLLGSGPRDAVTGIGLGEEEYNPDNFRLIQLPSGEWTVGETCDRSECSPVQVVGGSTF